MANFNDCIKKLLINEGVYSNDSTDSGGETVYGISRKNFPNAEIWKIVDQERYQTSFPNCLKDNQEILLLVNEFYQANFWQPIQGDRIINGVKAFSLFDFAVNSGISQAVKIVQRALGVTDDGVMGNNTVNGLNNANLEEFIAKFKIEKVKFYVKIVDNKPNQIKYLKGWIKRALEM